MRGALPNLIIAGVTKAGTTSLFFYLGQHPSVGSSDVKEIDHYAPMVAGDEPPPLDDYAAHFAHCADAPWRLEASPRYFIGGRPLVDRLADDLAGVRIVIAIREPVARMWSSYTYKRSKSRLPDDLDFAGFVARCRAVADAGTERDPANAAFRTLASGRYAHYLPDWFERFGDDLRVVFFESLAARPALEVAGLCSWLGVDPEPVAGFSLDARNSTSQPRSQALRRAAERLNSHVGRGPARRVLGAAYRRVNTGRLDERFGDADREELARYYRPTIAPLRTLLIDHGYTDLPDWLSG